MSMILHVLKLLPLCLQVFLFSCSHDLCGGHFSFSQALKGCHAVLMYPLPSHVLFLPLHAVHEAFDQRLHWSSQSHLNRARATITNFGCHVARAHFTPFARTFHSTAEARRNDPALRWQFLHDALSLFWPNSHLPCEQCGHPTSNFCGQCCDPTAALCAECEAASQICRYCKLLIECPSDSDSDES